MPKHRARTRGAVARRRAVLVDSGAWIALLRANDSHHAEADGMFRYAVARRLPLVTTNLVVAEVYRLLLFRTGIRPARLFLERLQESSHLDVVFADSTHHEAARRWLAKLDDQTITYTDAVSFAVMKARGCREVMSFDHDFLVAGFSLWQAPD